MARRANLSGGGRDQDCLGPFHLAATPAIGPDDLRDEPLVMFPRHADQSLYDRLLKHAIGSRRRDLLVAVAQGEGVALIPTSAEDLGDSSTVLVPRPLTRALFMPDTVVVWRVAAPERLAESLASIRVLASTLYSA
jgi:DNA-binding transcriptional LysR family regulator